MKVNHLKRMAVACWLGLMGASAMAADPLTLTVTQNGHTWNQSYDSFDLLVNTYKSDAELMQAFPGYDPKQGSSAVLNNLGVQMLFQVDKLSGSQTRVSMSIPAIGYTKTYVDSSRQAAANRLKEDIKAQYSAIQRAIAKITPNSVTAGNPSSMQSQMVASQFDQGFISGASQVIGAPATSSGTTSSGGPTAGESTGTGTGGAVQQGLRSSSLVGLGLNIRRFRQDDIPVQTYGLPLSYGWQFDEHDERRRITLSVPLMGGTVGDIKVFSAQASLAVGIPMDERWTLTPSIAYGVAGSLGLAQAAHQVGVALTSAYKWDLPDGAMLSMGNMVAYYNTLKMKVDEYTSNPNISNVVLRNGLMYATPVEGSWLGAEKLTAEFSIVNTQYLGTELYVKSSNEVGVTVGTAKNILGAQRQLRVGLTYVFAKDASGAGINFGYWF
jgi:hypothetical protein